LRLMISTFHNPYSCSDCSQCLQFLCHDW
jgi:hypothetical protein